ncbi:hypothetical protein DFH08DRAFT_944599 [Mycena albidolilacea]|uniref:Uncharacterized protein n=1 Tax=Mycena albidolilacea TaxID=1033008 RepID=A0AAD6Z512_9AGAR|nr:hypothetical protein DFH08DRAFT_944599 [Mycena albidolilacea]
MRCVHDVYARFRENVRSFLKLYFSALLRFVRAFAARESPNISLITRFTPDSVFALGVETSEYGRFAGHKLSACHCFRATRVERHVSRPAQCFLVLPKINQILRPCSTMVEDVPRHDFQGPRSLPPGVLETAQILAFRMSRIRWWISIYTICRRMHGYFGLRWDGGLSESADDSVFAGVGVERADRRPNSRPARASTVFPMKWGEQSSPPLIPRARIILVVGASTALVVIFVLQPKLVLQVGGQMHVTVPPTSTNSGRASLFRDMCPFPLPSFSWWNLFEESMLLLVPRLRDMCKKWPPRQDPDCARWLLFALLSRMHALTCVSGRSGWGNHLFGTRANQLSRRR